MRAGPVIIAIAAFLAGLRIPVKNPRDEMSMPAR
jgi:hypothetical protein